MMKLRTLIFLMIAFIVLNSAYAQAETDFMDISLEELLNIKITSAGKTDEKVSEIPASVVIITRRDIERHGYTTLTEVLEHIPGLYNIDDYADVSGNFGFRGFWSDLFNSNIIIMVNGVNQSMLGFASFGSITLPVEAIDRIEVIRGPMSVIYGNGASFGVINIVTDQLDMHHTELISGSYGSLNKYKAVFRKTGKGEDFKYAVTAAYCSDEGMDVPFKDMIEVPESLPYFGVPIDHTTEKLLEHSSRYFHVSSSFKDIYFDVSYNETSKEFFFLFPSVDEGSVLDQATTNLLIGYKHELSDKIKIDEKLLYYKKQERDTYDAFFPGFYGFESYWNTGFEVELNLDYRPKPDLDIISGINYRRPLQEKIIVDVPSSGDSDITNMAVVRDLPDIRSVFSQATYRPADHLNLVAGLRLENIGKLSFEERHFDPQTGGSDILAREIGDENKIYYYPRLAAVFKLDSDHIIKLLYGEGGKIINPGEDPERTRTIEINHVYSLSSLVISSSLFYNSLSDLQIRNIQYDPETQIYREILEQSGKMTTFGGELTLTMEPIKQVSAEISGTIQETSDDNNDDIEVAYSPKMLGYFKATYLHEYFTLGLTTVYVGEMQPAWNPARVNPDESLGGRIGDKVDSYLVLGANLRLENIMNKGLFINLRISNLLDSEIRYPASVGNANESFGLTKGTFGPKRNFLLTVGKKF